MAWRTSNQRGDRHPGKQQLFFHLSPQNATDKLQKIYMFAYPSRGAPRWLSPDCRTWKILGLSRTWLFL